MANLLSTPWQCAQGGWHRLSSCYLGTSTGEPRFNIKTLFPGLFRLIFIMRIPILARQHFYPEPAPGPSFNTPIFLYLYYYENKTVLWLSYNENSYTGTMSSLYWNISLVPTKAFGNISARDYAVPSAKCTWFCRLIIMFTVRPKCTHDTIFKMSSVSPEYDGNSSTAHLNSWSKSILIWFKTIYCKENTTNIFNALQTNTLSWQREQDTWDP